jgi:hypothetical protein
MGPLVKLTTDSEGDELTSRSVVVPLASPNPTDVGVAHRPNEGANTRLGRQGVGAGNSVVGHCCISGDLHMIAIQATPENGRNGPQRGTVALMVTVELGEDRGMKRPRSSLPIPTGSGSFAGFRYPLEVILLAVRWYLRFGLSYRDLEELLAERGIEVDHVTLYRWVQRFKPLLVEAARPCRHAVGDR